MNDYNKLVYIDGWYKKAACEWEGMRRTLGFVWI